MLAAEEARRVAEEAHKASEARFAQLQQEAARDRAAADERFAGLLDGVTQRQDAQIQQMQQDMFAMFGMIQQLLTHTGLVPQQQTCLQGMSAPALAPTPTPVLAPAQHQALYRLQLGSPCQLSSRLYHRCRSSSHLLGLHSPSLPEHYLQQ
jgi:hypothetical protein